MKGEKGEMTMTLIYRLNNLFGNLIELEGDYSKRIRKDKGVNSEMTYVFMVNKRLTGFFDILINLY